MPSSTHTTALAALLLLIALLGAAGQTAVAQSDLTWKSLTAFDAISIVADPTDVSTLWIAGHGGLHRYEPPTGAWRTFTTADGLSKIWTETVLVEPEVAWVGTEQGGANRFDRSTGQFTPFLQDVAEEPLTIWAFASDAQRVWAGTDQGVFEVNRSDLQTMAQYTSDDGLGYDHVTALANDEQHLWITTSYSSAGVGFRPDVGGLSRLDKATGAIEHFTLPDAEALDWFTVLAEAGDTLWVGGYEGLFVFDKTTSTFTPVAPTTITNRVTSLLVTDEYVWCTAIPEAPELLYRIDRASLELTGEPMILPEPRSGSSARVADLAAGPNHLYVVRGEHFLRISRATGAVVDTIDVPLLPYLHTDGLGHGSDIFFIGSDEYLLKVSPEATILSERALRETAQQEIRHIAAGASDVWVGTHDGLLRIDTANLDVVQTYFPGTRIRTLKAAEGEVWMATRSGLYCIDEATGDTTAVALAEQLNLDAPPLVFDVVLDGGGAWLGYSGVRGDTATVYGVARLDRTTLEVVAATEPDAATYGSIVTLADAGDALITGGDVIGRLAKDDLSDELLIEHPARLLQIHEDQLWVAYGSPLGEGGVAVYVLSEPDLDPILTLDETKGLLHNYVTKLYLTDDYQHAWLTTNAGVSVLDLDSATVLPVEDRPEAPTLALHPGYPNPFSDVTALPVVLDRPAHVQLDVYDVLGRRVASLADDRLAAGRHTFRWHAQGQPAGVYFARLRVGDRVATRPLVVVD